MHNLTSFHTLMIHMYKISVCVYRYIYVCVCDENIATIRRLDIFIVPPLSKFLMSCSNSSLLSTHCQATAGLLSPYISLQFLECYIDQSVQLLSGVQLFATPWTAACQAPPSITNFWNLLKLMSIEAMVPSKHLILCCPLLLLLSLFPSISLFQWVSSSLQVAKVLELQL